jgi:hypothetical protein
MDKWRALFGNEPSDSVKCRVVFEFLSDWRLLKDSLDIVMRPDMTKNKMLIQNLDNNLDLSSAMNFYNWLMQEERDLEEL